MNGLLLLLAGTAAAADVEVGGNLKLFHISSYPFDNDFFAAEVQDGSVFTQPFPLEDDVRASASSSGLLTSRFTFDLYADWLTVSVHPQLTVQPAGASSGLSITQTGTGIPQAVDLSWEAIDDPDLLGHMRSEESRRRAAAQRAACAGCMRPCWAEVTHVFRNPRAALEAIATVRPWRGRGGEGR